MNEVILVKRNSGGSCYVEFIRDAGRVRVRCNCESGRVGRICRHKRALLRGQTKLLAQPDQAKALKRILAWPEIEPLIANARAYEDEMHDLESQIKDLAEREHVIKQRFGSDCLDGVHES